MLAGACNTHQSSKNKENKEVNILDHNPNNSYETKKIFTGLYTEVNSNVTLSLGRFPYEKKIRFQFLGTNPTEFSDDSMCAFCNNYEV